ncbi:unnamed protein product [Agarophyton chilense]
MALVTRALSSFLTFAFAAAAISKLYPNHPNYEHMSEKAPSWLAALHLQRILTADQLQMAIALIELSCALLLPFTKAANYGLILVMLGAIYTHYSIDGALTKEAAPASFLLALLCLLLVFRNAQQPLREQAAHHSQTAATHVREGHKED